MWIKASTFERLIKERSEAQGVGIALERMVSSQRATLDFLLLRLQQVEHERAILTEKFLGVSLPVPVVKQMPSPASQITADDLLNSMPNFEDMGDDAAKEAGIDWNEQGQVVYNKKA